MKITNPNWHPQSWSQLTTAQRSNLDRLGSEPMVLATNGRMRMSFIALVRHGLAEDIGGFFRITAAGSQILGQGKGWSYCQRCRVYINPRREHQCSGV